jgi:raffinose/stachyose/melibiose transport system substrate-binding protein
MKYFFSVFFSSALFLINVPPAAAETSVKILYIQPNPEVVNIWKHTAADFEKLHPGVKIEFSFLENEAFKDKLPTLMQSNDIPSAYHSWGGGILFEQIRAGMCKDITPWIDPNLKNSFFAGGIDDFTYEGKVFGIPNLVAPWVVWYNKKLCQKAGVDPTQIHDWNNFVEAIKKCLAAGIVPVAVGGKEKWPLHLYTTALMLRLAGHEGVADAVAGKNGGLAGPDFVEAFQLFQQFCALNPFQPGYLARSYPEAAGYFREGKAAFHFMGSWDLQLGPLNSADQKGIPEDDIGWIQFPLVKGGKGTADELLANLEGWATTRAANKETVEFLEYWMSKDPQTKLAAGGYYIPMAKGTVDVIKDPLQKDMATLAQNAKSLSLAMNIILGTDVGNVFIDATTDVAAGKVKPEDAAKQIEQAWRSSQ